MAHKVSGHRRTRAVINVHGKNDGSLFVGWLLNVPASSSSSAVDSHAGQIFSPVDATKPAVQ